MRAGHWTGSWLVSQILNNSTDFEATGKELKFKQDQNQICKISAVSSMALSQIENFHLKPHVVGKPGEAIPLDVIRTDVANDTGSPVLPV